MKFNLSKVKYCNADLKRGLILPNKLNSELAEEIGLHVGDGTMNFYLNKRRYLGKYSLRGHIIDDMEHYNLRIKKLYKRLYNLDLNLSKMESTGVYGFQIWSDGLVNFKHKILDLSLGNKVNIKIPKVLSDRRKYVADVIRGIFDTDGCIYLENKNRKLYPRIQIGTTSKVLAEQLKKNISKLNLKATIVVENRKHKGWNDLYVICVRGDLMFRKWMKEINPANPKHISKFNYYLANS